MKYYFFQDFIILNLKKYHLHRKQFEKLDLCVRVSDQSHTAI